jgi:hypothetical protein
LVRGGFLGTFTGGGDFVHGLTWEYGFRLLSWGFVLLKSRLIDVFDYDNPSALDWFSRGESA